MKNLVITSGSRYNDIDVVASAYAYREILRNEGKETLAVLYGKHNFSVTEEIKSWELKFDLLEDYSNCEFVIVDVSDPNKFAPFVVLDRVVEIYDHHFGFIDYWKDRLGEKSNIEPVGACATLIWQEFCKRDMHKTITPLSANLLLTAIISNTLNFKSSMTQNADLKAVKQLKTYTTLPKNWPVAYFGERENFALENPKETLQGDTQEATFPNLVLDMTIGQLELWESSKFFDKNKPVIKGVMAGFGNEYWFLTSPSISEGKNYFYTESEKARILLEKVFNLSFENGLAVYPKLILRKEIKKKLLEI